MSIFGVIDDVLGTDISGGRRRQRDQTRAARDAQLMAVSRANQSLGDIYRQQSAQLEPWQGAGRTALNDLASGNILNNFEGDPGYQFRFNEGQKAVQNSAAARGMLNSGRTLKALTRFGQGFASDEYDRAYDRNFRNLSTVAGLGANATGQRINALQNFGNQRASNILGGGNASASHHMANMIADQNRRNNFSNLIATGGGIALGLAR